MFVNVAFVEDSCAPVLMKVKQTNEGMQEVLKGIYTVLRLDPEYVICVALSGENRRKRTTFQLPNRRVAKGDFIIAKSRMKGKVNEQAQDMTEEDLKIITERFLDKYRIEVNYSEKGH